MGAPLSLAKYAVQRAAANSSVHPQPSSSHASRKRRHLLEPPPRSERITDEHRKRVGNELRIFNVNVAANKEQTAAVRAALVGAAVWDDHIYAR